MMFAAAVLVSATVLQTLAPTPSELCDAIAHDAGTRGYLLVGPSGEDWDGTCLLEDFGPDGQGWDAYPIEDLEVEDYLEDSSYNEYVLTLPSTVIYGTVRL